jgi:Fe2+ or Zn2+ uptake regulation protein
VTKRMRVEPVVFQTLVNSPTPLSAAEVVEQAKLPAGYRLKPPSVRLALKNLCGQGRVIKIAAGMYQLAARPIANDPRRHNERVCLVLDCAEGAPVRSRDITATYKRMYGTEISPITLHLVLRALTSTHYGPARVQKVRHGVYRRTAVPVVRS